MSRRSALLNILKGAAFVAGGAALLHNADTCPFRSAKWDSTEWECIPEAYQMTVSVETNDSPGIVWVDSRIPAAGTRLALES